MGSSSFDPTWQARLLERRLRRYVGKRVDITVTDNRSTIVAVRRRPDILRARVHHMFVYAPREVVRALAGYIARADRRDSALVGGYITANEARIHEKGRRRRCLHPYGRTYDLQTIFDDLNRRYFAGRIKASITWGLRTRTNRPRASIQTGSYSVEDRLIYVHRALDQSWVPRWFVAWIVYHEILHAVHDIRKVNGRRCFHPPEFLADERRFVDHDRARRWEQENLGRLLRA